MRARQLGLALLACFMLAACGHHSGGAGVGSAAVPAVMVSTHATLQSALAQLDALEKPEGVDGKVWWELKGALREALECRAEEEKNGSGELQFATGLKVSRPGGRESHSTRKLVSTPPTGPANKVNDLTVTRETNGDFTLSWHYRNLGDYDQNGVVGVTDITPLAMHFGETYDAQTESDSIQAVIDGSASGKVGVEDVTQIAQNFGVAVAKYSVRGSDAYVGPFAETAIVGVSPQVSDARKVLTMNLGASPLGYWQVVPQDAENAQGEASNVAGISLQIRSVTPMEVKEGTVVTFSADVLGAGPFTYDWDFGGQAVPATSTEASPKVVLTRDTGNFPARLTVTNHMGNTAYPFTLTKLAREWKYEVMLDGASTYAKGTCLKYSNGELWFYAEDGGSPLNKYLVHGIPNSWTFEKTDYHGVFDIGDTCSPSFLYADGPFMSKTLRFAGMSNGEWGERSLAEAKTFGFDLAVDSNGNIFAVYIPLVAASVDSVFCMARLDGSWLDSSLVDSIIQGYSDTSSLSIAADYDFPPVVTYSTWDDATHQRFKYAAWNESSISWTTGLIEETAEGGLKKTGVFQDVKYSQSGTLGVAYSSVAYNTIEGAYYDYLEYAELDAGSWSAETLAQQKRNDDMFYNTNYFLGKSLVYDPLDGPVVACLDYIFNEEVRHGTLTVRWKNGGSWASTTISTIGPSVELNVSAALDDQGELYVLYGDGDGTSQEVVLARYE